MLDDDCTTTYRYHWFNLVSVKDVWGDVMKDYEAMRNYIADYCMSYVSDDPYCDDYCMGCPIDNTSLGGCYGKHLSNDAIEENYNKLVEANKVDVKAIMEEYEPKEPTEDLIHHPNHYTYREMECIDEMVYVFGLDAALTFCKLNAWKYRYRTSEKGGEQDMQKSDRYIGMIKELTEKYGDTN